jgi:hypothetical protein
MGRILLRCGASTAGKGSPKGKSEQDDYPKLLHDCLNAMNSKVCLQSRRGVFASLANNNV